MTEKTMFKSIKSRPSSLKKNNVFGKDGAASCYTICTDIGKKLQRLNISETVGKKPIWMWAVP